jgi:hypothetical protein
MSESNTHRHREPWERYPDEERHQYQAFEIYANLPPHERSLKQAYRLYTHNPNATSPSDTFKGWARRYNWKKRAAAWDDAKAKARFEGELKGTEKQWERLGAQRERMHIYVMELAEEAFHRAHEIYQQQLNKNNYSMAHAVQMSKFVLECYRMLIELEKVHKAHEEGRWTEEDDRALLEVLEKMEAREEAQFFEDAWHREQQEGSKNPGEDAGDEGEEGPKGTDNDGPE